MTPDEEKLVNRAIDTMVDVSNQLAVLRAQLDATTTSLGGIEHKLNGNGTEGLVVRVDRLEQSDKKRSFIANTAVGAAVVALVGVAIDLLYGGKS